MSEELPPGGPPHASPGPIRVLHLEDDEVDAELAHDTLEAEGLACDMRRVDSRESFERALASDAFDLILSDFNLPSFDGLTALTLAKRYYPDTPFIFLSGTLGDETVTQCLKDGATDCVLKQRMARLPSAVKRALREARLDAARWAAEDEVRRLTADLEARVLERSRELEALNHTLALRERELDQTRGRLQSILDFSPAVIVVKDIEGRYVIANRMAAILHGRSAQELIGQKGHDVMPPRLADTVRHNEQQVIREGRAFEFEEIVKSPDGMRVFASSRFPLYDDTGTLTGTGTISHDITDRKRADDEIKLARMEALRAMHAKSEFLSRMSHELRTPLNAILGFAQLFEPARLTGDEAENVRLILAAGRHLLALINDVLDITRIDTGHLTLSPEPVGVAEVVKAAVDLIQPLAARHSVSITAPEFGGPVIGVLADRLRLGQILLNLLSNAVKYNHVDGRVTIAAERLDTGRVRISVTDTGPGIPRAKLKRLFQPFERLDAGQTAVEGTGLGLSLSRALAQAMAGTLEVESTVDRGSTFWVELAGAAVPDAVVVSTKESDALAQADSGCVVYIEDNLMNARLMARVVERRPGVTLRHAPLAAAGLELVRQSRPALVLLDMQLPDMSGEDLLRQLRLLPNADAFRIVVLTADASAGLARRVKAGGAFACVTKPFDISQMLRVMDEALARPGGAQP